MKIVAILILFFHYALGDVLKVATYNVENLFDLKRNGYEYKEYIPYGYSQWNQKNYTIKLNNTARVIKDIDADIIGLQEIESLQALKDLRKTLKRKGVYYPYYAIANKKNTTVKVALLSKIPFLYAKEVRVTSSYKYRNILEVKYKLKNGEYLYIFVNHWKSKSGPESMRIVSAKALKRRVAQLGYDKNIIALGDFNSHYEEYKTFQRKRKLNNTHGHTGINHILGTLDVQKPAHHIHLQKGDFYNLWYDIAQQKRYTHIYRKHKEALDSILVTQALLDAKGIDYIPHSLKPFDAPYLVRKNFIYRWQMSYGKRKKHKGKGYSDHLPLVAKFSY